MFSICIYTMKRSKFLIKCNFKQPSSADCEVYACSRVFDKSVSMVQYIKNYLLESLPKRGSGCFTVHQEYCIVSIVN